MNERVRPALAPRALLSVGRSEAALSDRPHRFPPAHCWRMICLLIEAAARPARMAGLMGAPNLEEGTWERAKADAEAAYRSAVFYVTEGIVGVIAAGIGVLLTTGADSTQTQVVVPILAGIVGVLLPPAAVLVAHLALAPRRQRDELRAAWPSSEPPAPKTSIRLTALNLLRRWRDIGADPALRLSSRSHADSMWADSAITFLSENVPTDYTERFINGDEEERLEVLQEVADKADRFSSKA